MLCSHLVEVIEWLEEEDVEDGEIHRAEEEEGIEAEMGELKIFGYGKHGWVT